MILAATDNFLYEDGARALATALPKLTLLSRLKLTGPTLSHATPDLLPHDTLPWQCNAPGMVASSDVEISTPRGAEALAVAVQGLTRLVALDVSCEWAAMAARYTCTNGVRGGGSRLLGACARGTAHGMPCVAVNRFYSAGMAKLAPALGRLVNLRQLYLAGTSMRLLGAQLTEFTPIFCRAQQTLESASKALERWLQNSPSLRN